MTTVTHAFPPKLAYIPLTWSFEYRTHLNSPNHILSQQTFQRCFEESYLVLSWHFQRNYGPWSLQHSLTLWPLVFNYYWGRKPWGGRPVTPTPSGAGLISAPWLNDRPTQWGLGGGCMQTKKERKKESSSGALSSCLDPPGCAELKQSYGFTWFYLNEQQCVSHWKAYLKSYGISEAFQLPAKVEREAALPSLLHILCPSSP